MSVFWDFTVCGSKVWSSWAQNIRGSSLKGWPLSDAAFTEQWRLNLIQASSLYSPTLQPAGSTTCAGGCRAGDASSSTFILLLLFSFLPDFYLTFIFSVLNVFVCLLWLWVPCARVALAPFNRLTAVYCCHHVIHSCNSSIFCSDFSKTAVWDDDLYHFC